MTPHVVELETSDERETREWRIEVFETGRGGRRYVTCPLCEARPEAITLAGLRDALIAHMNERHADGRRDS